MVAEGRFNSSTSLKSTAGQCTSLELVHLQGVLLKTGCTAEDGEREFGARAAETLRKNFYVDDALRSVPTEKDVVELIQAVKEMCTKGGFKPKKFVNNSRKMLMSVPAEDREKEEIKGLYLGSAYLHTYILVFWVECIS